MSVSPKLESTTTTTTNATTNSTTTTTTNSQLAALLSDSCREVESLRKDLAIAKKRAEKAERLLSSLTQTNTNSSNQIQDSATRAILECESRAERAELARDDAESRKRLITDNWFHLERYLASLEAHYADARHAFSRIITDGSGQLSLATVPVIGQPSPHHAMPPPVHPSRHQLSTTRGSPLNHRGSHSVQSFPSNLPLPPLPNPNSYPQTRVRPRAGSLEGAGQPPAKKPRSDARGKEGREDRAMYSESPIDHIQFSHNSAAQYPRSSPYSPQTQHAHLQSQHLYPHQCDPEREAFTHQRARLPQSQAGVTRSGPHSQRRPKRAHSQTRSPSRSSSRSSASSLSVDEMLLQATAGTDDAGRRLNPNGIPNGSGSASGPSPPPTNRQPHTSHPRHRPHGHAPPEIVFNHSNRRPDSPASDYRSHGQQLPLAHHASGPPAMSGPGVPAPAASDAAGPLPQPGQVQTYQTHVFAPVVTGAPVKKSKFMNSGSSAAASGGGSAGGPLLAPSSSDGHLNASAAAETPLPTSYPATNAQGQRICRQCGLPGRYKEGKCVEKWGPGPHGPGTVCDRCRKKMKRVERRGTADNQLALAHAMNPLAAGPRPPLQTPTSFRAHPAPLHRSDTLPAPHRIGYHYSGTAYPSPRGAAAWSPPPTIVTLGEDTAEGEHLRVPRGGMMGPASRGHSRSSSRNGRTPHRERVSPPEGAVNGAGSAKRSPLGSDASSGGGREHAGEAEPAGGRAEGEAEGEADADAEAEADADADAEVDAEVDGEADADAEAELLEAVDAAEANSSGSGGGAVWPKKEEV